MTLGLRTRVELDSCCFTRLNSKLVTQTSTFSFVNLLKFSGYRSKVLVKYQDDFFLFLQCRLLMTYDYNNIGEDLVVFF